MALYNLGLALIRVNRRAEALSYLERYLEVSPADDPDRDKVVQLVKRLKSYK